MNHLRHTDELCLFSRGTIGSLFWFIGNLFEERLCDEERQISNRFYDINQPNINRFYAPFSCFWSLLISFESSRMLQEATVPSICKGNYSEDIVQVALIIFFYLSWRILARIIT